jgi:small-conductance mechanosensitive channel
MTPEERELLTRSIKISEENNRMLRGMRRSALISNFLRIVYWIIILATAFGTYYFIQPDFLLSLLGLVVQAQLVRNKFMVPRPRFELS